MKNINLKLFYLIIMILPVLSILPIFLLNIKKPLNVYPGTDFRNEGVCDAVYENGKSKILEYESIADSINVTYQLKQGYAYPFAMVVFRHAKPDGINISGFNRVKISVKARGAERIDIKMMYHVEGITDTSDYMTSLITSYDLETDGNYNDYLIDPDRFTVPEWAYYYNPEFYNHDKNILNKHKLISITVGSIQYPELDNNKVELVIENISLVKSNFYLYLLLAIITGTYYGICIFFILAKRRILMMRAKVGYLKKHIEIENTADVEAKKVIQYIHDHYNKSDLMITSVNKDTGISPRKISGIITKNFGVSFKQYVNEIRMDAAKSLIVETDQTVTEIAFSIGYNNSTHFYRIFKNYYGMSPTRYRKKYQKAKNK